jgi:activator of 2-hydroxyglutaryl-CoA dehydratase
VEKDFVMIGGMTKNQGFIDTLKRESDMDVIAPEDREYANEPAQ